MTRNGPLRLFISAGERSGDVHAAHFIRAARALRPDVEFEGFGGPSMAEAGCRLHRDMLDLSSMGVSFLKNVTQFLALLCRFWRLLRDRRPDALVLVDFPGFHLIIARIARARGIPVIYYICPQIWAWAPWRRRKILRLTDLLMVIMPFEVELYRNPRTPVVHVGHPLADELAAADAVQSGAALRRSLALPAGGRVIGIFPGSRLEEVRLKMPVYRNILDRMGLDPARHMLLCSACRSGFREIIEEELRGFPCPVRIDEGDARPLMAACDFALVASGTATLELAYFEKPMVVVYRLAPAYVYVPLVKFLTVTPYVCLVNILGRGEVVPERVLFSPDPADLPPKARDLFFDTPERENCIRRLARVREEVFQPGASDRAARVLFEFLDQRQ